jgi:hypothetical protein
MKRSDLFLRFYQVVGAEFFTEPGKGYGAC